jgi:hypothetical protein
VSDVSRTDLPLREHPDLMEMRNRYERANARPGAQLVEGATILTSLYLAISPFVVDFVDRPRLTLNNVITGLVAVLIAFCVSAAYGRTHGVAWVIAAIGVWTIIAPWAIRGLSAPTDIKVSNVITGGLLVLMGLAISLVGMRGRNMAGSHR